MLDVVVLLFFCTPALFSAGCQEKPSEEERVSARPPCSRSFLLCCSLSFCCMSSFLPCALTVSAYFLPLPCALRSVVSCYPLSILLSKSFFTHKKPEHFCFELCLVFMFFRFLLGKSDRQVLFFSTYPCDSAFFTMHLFLKKQMAYLRIG